jgi:hypothetical protein
MLESKPPKAATPPLHAVLVVIGAWLFFFALIGFYAMATLLLLPALPLILAGPVCFLAEAHRYAAEAAERQRRH